MKDLFTICITHYNQMKYIFTAIDSVLAQDYPNIELIIADDASNFNKEKVEKYINLNKKENIKKVTVLTKEKNLGTVKNVNGVLRIANGNYITFFAADDALSNSKVISNYYKAFKKFNKEVITAQAFLYDEDLKNNNGPYVDVKKALKYNDMKPSEVFYYMAQNCFYASGATAYKMDVFNKYGLFDERYLLVEDWSYYLHLLKNDVSIFFANFKALNHRDGGVSHNVKITPTVKKYYEDILKIYEYELLNDMPKISNSKKLDIYNKCRWDFNYICELINISNKDYYLELIDKSIKKYIGGEFALLKIALPKKMFGFLKWHVFYKFKYLNRNNHILVISIIYWFLINKVFLETYYLDASLDNKLIYLSASLLVSCLSANLFVGIGDMMEYCIPITLLLISNSNALINGDIIKIIILFLIVYVSVYYLIYILKILLNKIKSNI